MNTNNKAVLALLIMVVLFSFSVIIARVLVFSIPPFFVHFFRMLFASIAFLPFFIKSRCWQKEKFSSLLIVSVFASLNLVGFIWGIQYTTASASQIIYSAQPILIIIIGYLFLNEKYPGRKIIGVITGLAGVIYIVFLSKIEGGTTISGSLVGNLTMILAMSGWLTYTLLSKKLSKYFKPIEISSTSILVALAISIPLLFWPGRGKVDLSVVSLPLFWAIFYMGIFGTFFTHILFQYAVKHTSSLTVSLASYIQPITTTFLAIILIGETLTLNFVAGSSLVFLGVFLSTALEAHHRRKSA